MKVLQIVIIVLTVVALITLGVVTYLSGKIKKERDELRTLKARTARTETILKKQEDGKKQESDSKSST